VQKIEAESHERLLKNDHQDEQRATVALMLFGSDTAVPVKSATPRRQARGRSGRAGGNGRVTRSG
jgi:hypothetical protein